MKFLFDSKLNSAIEILIKEAKDKLVIVSPYIKLTERVKGYLKNKINKDSLHIIVVFGKNTFNHERSLSESDLRFFMEFPNIEIKYEERLHAKYYANDFNCIRTGTSIPFNPEKPFSAEGYKIWAKSKLEDGPEHYCHYSGEPSGGQTSNAKPILRKNWSKAKSLIKS